MSRDRASQGRSGGWRLPQGGLIARDRPVTFSFDGRTCHGFDGDTLASALLASGVRVVGRSFKYHRPRGVVTAGPEEPNALVTAGAGAHRTPNVRATVQEVWNGLRAESQNRWPSLHFDVLAANNVLHRLIGAGFYYKTFMWPRHAWEGVYEPAIRRAAGLGRLAPDAAPVRAERAFAHCDLLVVGAGPAGLAAACAASRAGADVILADEGFRMGGRLLAETRTLDGAPGHLWADEAVRELARSGNVRLMPRTTVTGWHDGATWSALERVSEHEPPRPGRPAECFWRIVAPQVVLATGAIERTIAFSGNDRPGVMQAAAVRAYVNRWGVAPGRRVAVFGANPDARRTADDLLAAGVEVVAVIDPRPDAPDHPEVPVLRGQVTGTRGWRGIAAVAVRRDAGDEVIWPDCLAVAGGWSPVIHLGCQAGARPVWRADLLSFGLSDLPGWLHLAGSVTGAASLSDCLAQGVAAAQAAVGAGPVTMPSAGAEPPWTQAPFWEVRAGRGRAFLDQQNDVSTRDVRAAIAEGMTHPEHVKRWTTQGMATDQGKTSDTVALAVVAEATGCDMADIAPTTYRPPYTPVPISALAAGAEGERFAPLRRIPSAAACSARGAPMVEAGLWRRPSYFPRPGETHWRQSCDREVLSVRETVGVVDVSSLGKVQVTGPDAAAFLDFVYAGRMGDLAPGRVRYGVMLREDGHALDDGTCARLGAEAFLLTTTTAAAGEVFRHLSFAQQVLRPDLALRIADVTEHWAQMAVAGPRSRELLAAVLDAVPDLVFMRWAEMRVAGVAGRLFRISFSGELGFELAVPARYGAALWQVLVAQAETLGGCPYGLEALEVLRIEKGFLTHREIDGRTTAFDLGLEAMVRPGRIGAAAAERPGLRGAGRAQLVGLASEDELPAGALLFPSGRPTRPEEVQGNVTSACWSPTLERYLALALLRNGRARHGETLHAVDRMRSVEASCEVRHPVFFDPEGERARG